MQSNCIRFSFQLDKMSMISHKEFKDLNWLTVSTWFEQCVISIVFKFINGKYPYYLNEVFEFALEGNISLRNNFLRLKCHFWNANTGQKALSFVGSSFWNQNTETLKKADNLNTLKHLKIFLQSNDLFFIVIIIFVIIIILLLFLIIILITSTIQLLLLYYLYYIMILSLFYHH